MQRSPEFPQSSTVHDENRAAFFLPFLISSDGGSIPLVEGFTPLSESLSQQWDSCPLLMIGFRSWNLVIDASPERAMRHAPVGCRTICVHRTCGRASHMARPSGDFRFWEGQEEQIGRGYLQFASNRREKERGPPAFRMGGSGEARQEGCNSLLYKERIPQMQTAVLEQEIVTVPLEEVARAGPVAASPGEPARSITVALTFLIGCVALMMTGFAVILPVFPQRLQALGLGPEMLALMEAAFGLGMFLFSTPMGAWSGWWPLSWSSISA